MDLDAWLAQPFEEGRWHRLSEWLDSEGSSDMVDDVIARLDEWPEQHLAAVKEWGHNELGAHALRELLLWHWLAVPSKHHILRLVSALRIFGASTAESVRSELSVVQEHLNLDAVSLRNCDMEGESLERFIAAANSDETISYLELRGNALRSSDLAALGRLQALKHLDLRVNPNLWDRPSASALPLGVETLLLENTGLDDMALRAICGSYDQLRVLGLSGNAFTDEGVEEFFAGSSLPVLSSIYFGEAQVTGQSLEVLVETGVAAQLGELMLIGADLSELRTDLLPEFSALRTVALIDCQLRPATVETWLRSPAGGQLEWMDLTGNE